MFETQARPRFHQEIETQPEIHAFLKLVARCNGRALCTATVTKHTRKNAEILQTPPQNLSHGAPEAPLGCVLFRLCAPTSGRSGFGTPFLSFRLRKKVPKPSPRKSLKPRSSIGVLQKPLFHIRAPDPLFALRAPSFRIAARQGGSKNRKGPQKFCTGPIFDRGASNRVSVWGAFSIRNRSRMEAS